MNTAVGTTVAGVTTAGLTAFIVWLFKLKGIEPPPADVATFIAGVTLGALHAAGSGLKWAASRWLPDKPADPHKGNPIP